MTSEELHAYVYHVRENFHFECFQTPCTSHILANNQPSPAARREALMVPLLNACVEKLKLQQMKKMFIDAVASNVEGFKRLGMCVR